MTLLQLEQTKKQFIRAESGWHCSQEHLFMVTAGRQETEPRGSVILTPNYLMSCSNTAHSKIQQGQTHSGCTTFNQKTPPLPQTWVKSEKQVPEFTCVLNLHL